MKFEILKRETLAENFFTFYQYTLKHELFAGGWSEAINREMFQHGDAIALLLYDPDRDAVLMIEQFRIGAIHNEGHKHQSPWLIELVAGIIETDEEELEVARREAMEEANVEFSDIEFVTKYYVSPSSMPESISLYCAKIDSRNQGGIYGLDHEDEDIRVHVIKTQDAYRMVDEGKINSATPILALLWLQHNETRLKQQWGNAE
jgi:ADP-ribose pyrophosphatase